jgi:hypothetical protein
MAAAACGDRGHQTVGLWSQFGEMGPGLEVLLASVAKRGADEMADRYMIENREAAVGVQVFHVRQRYGAAIDLEGANTGPPWEAEVRSARVAGGKRPSRDVRRTQRRRPAARRTPVGLVLGASTQAAGAVPGTAATWVAPTGTPAARALGVAVAPAVGAWTPRARGARSPRGPVPWVFWGAHCAAWPIVKAPPPQKKRTFLFHTSVPVFGWRHAMLLPVACSPDCCAVCHVRPLVWWLPH